jgi:hypothetical protein
LIQNNTDNVVSGNYWLSVLLPDLQEVLIPGGLLDISNPLSGFIAGNDKVSMQNELLIPADADAGSYTLIGRIGVYPDMVLDEESIDFEVTATK